MSEAIVILIILFLTPVSLGLSVFLSFSFFLLLKHTHASGLFNERQACGTIIMYRQYWTVLLFLEDAYLTWSHFSFTKRSICCKGFRRCRFTSLPKYHTSTEDNAQPTMMIHSWIKHNIYSYHAETSTPTLPKRCLALVVKWILRKLISGSPWNSPQTFPR